MEVGRALPPFAARLGDVVEKDEVEKVVEAMGIEPTTSCMPCKRSTN